MTDFLRLKFQDTWVSVRKAFLDLDYDKDGEISPEDIMRYFGDQGNQLFDYLDLVKVLEDIDSKNRGTINYADFCKWMGGAIHKSEGFLFRHDSVKNPPYEENVRRKARLERSKENLHKMSVQEIQEALAKKIEFQWKTLKNAFNTMNLGKSGKIQKWEMKYFINHWGFKMSPEEFEEIYDRFDVDNDGLISYQDLQTVFGTILNPPESFYFRQDRKKEALSNVCCIPTCGFQPVGYLAMCIMHTK